MDRDARFLDLASRCLDGALTPAEENELYSLLDDPARRAAFAEVDRINQELLAALAAPLSDEAMTQLVLKDVSRADARESQVSSRMLAVMERVRQAPAPAARRRKRAEQAWLVPLGAAALLALAAGVLIHLTRSAAVKQLARVESVRGAVSCERGGREIVLTAQAALAASDVLNVGTNAQLTIVFADGTRVTADAGTRLSLQEEQGPQVLLTAGALSADVAPQAPDRALRFRSPHAVARVLGTRLRLEIRGTSTRLDVAEGRVRFIANDRQSVDVDAGKYAVAAAGETLAALDLKPPAPSVPVVAAKAEPKWEPLFAIADEWTVTHGDGRAGNGVLDLVSPDKAKSRVESVRHYGDFEAEFTFRLTGSHLAEFQLDGYHWFFQIDLGPRGIDAAWRTVKVRNVGGQRQAWMDGQPLRLHRGDSSTPGGPIAFYVAFGGRLEVRDARIREVK